MTTYESAAYPGSAAPGIPIVTLPPEVDGYRLRHDRLMVSFMPDHANPKQLARISLLSSCAASRGIVSTSSENTDADGHDRMHSSIFHIGADGLLENTWRLGSLDVGRSVWISTIGAVDSSVESYQHNADAMGSAITAASEDPGLGHPQASVSIAERLLRLTGASDALVTIVDVAPEKTAADVRQKLKACAQIVGGAAVTALVAKALHEDEGGRLLPILAGITWFGVLSAQIRFIMSPLVKSMVETVGPVSTGVASVAAGRVPLPQQRIPAPSPDGHLSAARTAAP